MPLAGACEIDNSNVFQMLQPITERKGLSGRLTFNLGERSQVYVMANYYNTDVFASFTPVNFSGTPAPQT